MCNHIVSAGQPTCVCQKERYEEF